MAQASKAGIGLILMSSVLMAHAVHAASSVAVQPGLWVGATETTINGKRVPNILDIKGALTAEQKTQITRAMSTYGLPSGWQPDAVCVKASTYDLDGFLGMIGRRGCKVSNVQSTAGKVRYKAHCELPNENMAPTTGEVEGEISLTSKTEWRMEAKMTGSVGGYPMTSVTKQVGKWMASDCRAVPKGLDPSLMGSVPGIDEAGLEDPGQE